MKRILIMAVVVIGVALGVVVLMGQKGKKRQNEPSHTVEPLRETKVNVTPIQTPPADEPVVKTEADSKPVPPRREPNLPPVTQPIQNTSQPRSAKRELQDPLAREALGLVGMDREAEAYWLEAIYDSSLPDKEREDLMEDLNEDGLSDIKRPGPEDLPVILNRLKLIEDIVPTADDFMLKHLAEAYKDLWNLAAITQGGGEPVR